MTCRGCGRIYNIDHDETGKPLRTAKAHSQSKGFTGLKEGDMELCLDCHWEQHNIGIKTFVNRHPMLLDYYPFLKRYL